MDEDLLHLDRDALLTEARRMREAIRQHRDNSGHDLCWHHPALWNLLPDKPTPAIAVPPWPEFLRGCVRYRESLEREVPEAVRVHPWAHFEAIRRRLEAAENAGDAEGIGHDLADDVIAMVPDHPVIEGKAESIAFIREMFRELFPAFDRHIEYTSHETAVMGDFGFDRGTFAATVAPLGGGEATRLTGKFLWILRQADGGWKIWRLLVSRDGGDEEREAQSANLSV
ncbi:MAG TPA: DUF4440 domain-containing protein [Longimicrobiales bacterium]|nr:DUF4440 domain-containing protein [Longimicrobiales bacterium]